MLSEEPRGPGASGGGAEAGPAPPGPRAGPRGCGHAETGGPWRCAGPPARPGPLLRNRASGGAPPHTRCPLGVLHTHAVPMGAPRPGGSPGSPVPRLPRSRRPWGVRFPLGFSFVPVLCRGWRRGLPVPVAPKHEGVCRIHILSAGVTAKSGQVRPSSAPRSLRSSLKITPEVKRAFGLQSNSTAAVSYPQNVPAKREMRVSCHHSVTEGDRREAALPEADPERPLRARSARHDRGPSIRWRPSRL